MTPDQTHSLIARFLTEPSFLLKTQSAVQAGVTLPTLDSDELERIRQFRGFITKVKHNALRRHIPATFGLMGALGIEHAFFCAFSVDYVAARAHGPLKTDQHLGLIANALEGFLAGEPTQTAIPVRETFVHEKLLYDLGKSDLTCAESEHLAWCGDATFTRRSIDVVTICNRLGARAFVLDDIRTRDHVLCYWRGADSTAVSIFEVDALTATVLTALKTGGSPDGAKTVLSKAGLAQLDNKAIHDVASAAARKGWLDLRGAWDP